MGEGGEAVYCSRVLFGPRRERVFSDGLGRGGGRRGMKGALIQRSPPCRKDPSMWLQEGSLVL